MKINPVHRKVSIDQIRSCARLLDGVFSRFLSNFEHQDACEDLLLMNIESIKDYISEIRHHLAILDCCDADDIEALKQVLNVEDERLTACGY